MNVSGIGDVWSRGGLEAMSRWWAGLQPRCCNVTCHVPWCLALAYESQAIKMLSKILSTGETQRYSLKIQRQFMFDGDGDVECISKEQR